MSFCAETTNWKFWSRQPVLPTSWSIKSCWFCHLIMFPLIDFVIQGYISHQRMVNTKVVRSIFYPKILTHQRNGNQHLNRTTVQIGSTMTLSYFMLWSRVMNRLSCLYNPSFRYVYKGFKHMFISNQPSVCSFIINFYLTVNDGWNDEFCFLYINEHYMF